MLSVSAGSNADAAQALAHLCEGYWPPVYAFICRKGYTAADAQDLAQEFFAQLLKTNAFSLPDSRRGKFRSFLLKSLQNFLINEHVKQHRIKRGGQCEILSLDNPANDGVATDHQHAAARGWDPELLFDVRWAATIVERALRKLGEECEARGRRAIFDSLSSYLTTSRDEIHYDDIATVVGLPVATVKALLHRLRSRHRELLRHEISRTVGTDADIDAEVRYLCTVLAAAKS